MRSAVQIIPPCHRIFAQDAWPGSLIFCQRGAKSSCSTRTTVCRKSIWQIPACEACHRDKSPRSPTSSAECTAADQTDKATACLELCPLGGHQGSQYLAGGRPYGSQKYGRIDCGGAALATVPTELTPCVDPDADLMNIVLQVSGTEGSIAPTDTFATMSGIEEFPMPDMGQAQAPETGVVPGGLVSSPMQQQLTDSASTETIRAKPQSFSRNAYTGSIRTIIPRHHLHEKLWTVMASTVNGQAVIDRLEQLCLRKDVGEIYARLRDLDFWNDQTATAALFRAAMLSTQKTPVTHKALEEEIDDPSDLQTFCRETGSHGISGSFSWISRHSRPTARDGEKSCTRRLLR
ncbi:hypothetical protein ACVWXL_005746 [Bradyrhizobium sp. GM22.5]